MLISFAGKGIKNITHTKIQHIATIIKILLLLILAALLCKIKSANTGFPYINAIVNPI